MKRLAEMKYERDRVQQRHREAVIAEFDGNIDTMADEILLYRRSLMQLATALDCAQAGTPFAVIPPGPHAPPNTK
jgi:hypothetical protein